jgi:predicted nucleic acid-binding protein
LALPLARLAESYVLDATEPPAAPDLMTAEVLQVIRAHERARRIGSDQAAVAARQLEDLRIVRYPALPFFRRAWELRHNFSAYDAMYVALAEALHTSLVTADARLARAVRDHSLARAVLLA